MTHTIKISYPPDPAPRHYHSAHSIWLSVDPMADKYPGLSPYTYCANNPVKLVDPNGMDIDNIEHIDRTANMITNTLTNKTSLIEIDPGDPPGEKRSFFNTVKEKVSEFVDNAKKTLNDWDRAVVGTAENREFEGHSNGGNVDAIAPYIESAVTVAPVISQTNDIKTIAGEDIFGNKSTTSDKVISCISLVTGGTAKIAVKAVSKVSKLINKVSGGFTAIKTLYNERKKNH